MDKHKEVKCSSSSSSSLVKEISSHPIFSILTTFSLLILLYFPYLFPLLFSPVLISTLLLLTTLLHFGSSIPIPDTEKKILADTNNVEDPIRVEPDTGMVDGVIEFEQTMNFCDSLVEWGRRGGPLEVIYEEFEGEELEEEEEEDNEEEAVEYSREYSCADPQRRLDFMGFYNTDSDANSDSSSLSSENMRFRWEEDEGEGMIEITLEEDNLIEIDLSVCR